MGGNGSPEAQSGCAIHLYAANRSMRQRALLRRRWRTADRAAARAAALVTELGRLSVEPLEIAVIPRGVRFRVELPEAEARGYVCENFGARLAPAGSGTDRLQRAGLRARFPHARGHYEDRRRALRAGGKVHGPALDARRIDHSPFDVVAWHGNYAPYKYDLRRFNTIGSISYDHPDPSIFLVLQSVTDTPGVDALDFVIFPPRWLAMQHTFRPPWFHRNVASEFMGLIQGVYDAKADGFLPGRRLAAQLHERSRPGCGHVRKRQPRRYPHAAEDHRHHGVHVRDPLRDPARPATRSSRRSCSRTISSAGRAWRALRSAAALALS